ncbi:MAG: penicillin acylase family protein, partial [Burkholderiales bacterium]|nr:penicillin acylase family protein [Burkholderiales bacterium]
YCICLFIILFLTSAQYNNNYDNIKLSWKNNPIYIQRDNNGVPNIYAENDNAVYFALGYVHAQDRLWQMEIERRLIEGKLSEIFGSKSIKSDKFFLTWGLYRTAINEWVHLDKNTQEVITSYTAGINAYLDLKTYPLQIKLLRFTPQKWSVYDTLAIQKLMAFNLQNNWLYKLNNAFIAQKYGESKINQFYPLYPTTAPTILSTKDLLVTKLPQKTNHRVYSKEQYSEIKYDSQILALNKSYRDILMQAGLADFSGKGSNSWVVSGKLTATKKPIIANDTHLFFSSPNFWYLANLKGRTINSVGATVPGFPGIIIGHNQNIAWGVTVGYADDQDLFIINKKSKLKHLKEIINVKESASVPLDILISDKGPIISANNSAIESLNLKQQFAIKWPALESTDITAQALIGIQTSKNWHQFTQQLKNFTSPSISVLYADIQGNIGYYLLGRTPIRNGFSGVLPVNENKNWSGYIPFEQMPHVYNPPENYIISANNKVVPDTYKYQLAYNWFTPPYRAQRIKDLITANPIITSNLCKTFQMDNVSYFWRDLAPILLQTQPNNELSKKALNILAAWNGKFEKNSIGATIFAYWMQQFALLSPFKSTVLRNNLPSPLYLKTLLATKNKNKYLSDSLKAAMKKLQHEQGKNSANWQWQNVHRAYFLEMGFSASKYTNWIWEQKVSSAGNFDTVNVGSFNFENFHQLFGATYREVIDLADINNAEYMIPLGQSEDRFSSNYANFLNMWADGEYIKINNLQH